MARSQTVSANALAATLSKRFGRTITAKMVRTVARDTLAQYDKVKHPAYQSHEYGADAQRRIADVFAARGQRSKASVKRTTARKPRAARTPAATKPPVAS